MQLRINHSTIDNPLILPINYNHILQSIIYDKLSADKYVGDYTHDCGWKYDERRYKLFQFSQLKGHYIVVDKNIVFDDMVTWEVRSIDDRIIMLIKDGIEKNGINYNNLHYSEINMDISDVRIDSDELYIKMYTPVCVYSTDPESKRVTYYSPEDEQFYNLVSENFVRKYNAYTGKSISDSISLELEKYSYKDKVVTKYKGNYISGWKGIYRLFGKREYLDFLYNVGLGARNSQGFGMFSVM